MSAKAIPADIERTMTHETVCGFQVAAYRETHPEHGSQYGHTYSEHWSTPNSRNPKVTVERLFTETQLREALATRPASAPPPPDGMADAVATDRPAWSGQSDWRDAFVIFRDSGQGQNACNAFCAGWYAREEGAVPTLAGVSAERDEVAVHLSARREAYRLCDEAFLEAARANARAADLEAQLAALKDTVRQAGEALAVIADTKRYTSSAQCALIVRDVLAALRNEEKAS